MLKEVKQKKPRNLTIKQRKFIDEVVKSGNATDAASKVYNCKNRNVARNIGPKNLAIPSIHEEIEARLKIAKDKVFELMNASEKDEIQLRAAQDIIDRLEGKAVQRLEHSGKVELQETIEGDQAKRIATRLLNSKE